MNLISNIYQPSIFRFRGDCSGYNLNPTPAPQQDEHTNHGRTRGHLWWGEVLWRDHSPRLVRHLEHLQHHQDAHQPHHLGKRFLSHIIHTCCSCLGNICNTQTNPVFGSSIHPFPWALQSAKSFKMGRSPISNSTWECTKHQPWGQNQSPWVESDIVVVPVG